MTSSVNVGNGSGVLGKEQKVERMVLDFQKSCLKGANEALASSLRTGVLLDDL